MHMPTSFDFLIDVAIPWHSEALYCRPFVLATDSQCGVPLFVVIDMSKNTLV